MFRIVAYCEDKHLGRCLSALKGIARIPDTPQEVVNGAMAGNGHGVVPTNNGNPVEIFKDWAKQNNHDEVRLIDIKGFLQTLGQSGSTAKTVLKNLQVANVVAKKVRKAGNNKLYKVL